MRSPWIAAALMLSMGGPSSARQDGRPAQTFGAGVDLVQVEVAVLDRNRRPIRGLQASDFTLLEDGQPRAVAAFAAVDLPARAAASGANWLREVPADTATNDVAPEGRLVVILMDRSIPFGLPAQSARDVAKAAIEQLAPGDLAAVVYTGSGASQGLTSDRARLLAAIGENPAAGLSREAAEEWTTAKDRLERDLWEANLERAIGDAKRGLPWLLPADNSGECYCGVCVLDSIRTIADAVRDTQGRSKSLLFIGADIVTDTADGRCANAVIDAREAMFRALDLANVTVHSFDANGLESNVIASSSQGLGVVTPVNPREGSRDGPTPTLPVARSQQLLTRQGHLGVLPDRTGGRLVLNTNNPEGRVPDVFRESGSYYLLGFEPTVTDGRPRTISVRVSRRDVQVRARRAYVASPALAPPAAPLAPAIRAMTGVLPARDGIRLTAHALPVAAPGTHDPEVVLALHAQHDVSKDPSPSRSESIDIVTAVLTVDGRPAGTFHQTVDVTPPASPGAPVAYDVLQRLPAKPGRYELRIAVHAPARSQSGSVYAYVDVPAVRKTAFSWSDIGLSAVGAKPAATDGVTEVVPALPVARRDFDRRERVTAFINGYHVSGALPAPLEIVSRIVDAENRKRFEQKASLAPTAFDASKTASYTLDLPLATLAPGPHLLTMEVRAGQVRTTRHVRFMVR